VNEEHFADLEELHTKAAHLFAELAAQSILARSRFIVALSGGSTPLPIYQRLATLSGIDWSRVHVFWSDERCVSPDDPASNYAAARAALLDRIRGPSPHVHRIPAEDPPSEAADRYEGTVRTIIPNGRFDLILLGMGVDGHTASLFPDHEALCETTRWFVPVRVLAKPAQRITMTLPLIVRARHVLMLTAGNEKERTRRRIVNGEQLPAGRVRPLDGTLTWYSTRNEP